MTQSKDPTEAICKAAADYANVDPGNACNQTSFKVGKTAFLFIGPGPKGVAFKAMFKLRDSMDQAKQLAGEQPERFDAGSTGWVTARFSAERPLPKKIWAAWLKESYTVSSEPKKKVVAKTAKKSRPRTAKKASKKRG